MDEILSEEKSIKSGACKFLMSKNTNRNRLLLILFFVSPLLVLGCGNGPDEPESLLKHVFNDAEIVEKSFIRAAEYLLWEYFLIVDSKTVKFGDLIENVQLSEFSNQLFIMPNKGNLPSFWTVGDFKNCKSCEYSQYKMRVDKVYFEIDKINYEIDDFDVLWDKISNKLYIHLIVRQKS